LRDTYQGTDGESDASVWRVGQLLRDTCGPRRGNVNSRCIYLSISSSPIFYNICAILPLWTFCLFSDGGYAARIFVYAVLKTSTVRNRPFATSAVASLGTWGMSVGTCASAHAGFQEGASTQITATETSGVSGRSEISQQFFKISL